MTHRFDLLDALTPAHGTAISEWLRLVDISANGCSIHEVRNVLACLIGVRYEAENGWNSELRERDIHLETRLRMILRGATRATFLGNDFVGARSTLLSAAA